MLLVYRCLISFLFPIIIIIILIRIALKKEDKKRFKEKLFSSSFNVKRNYNKHLIWFHAASIGELKSISSIIKKLNEKNDFDFLITTSTQSSALIASKEFSSEKNIMHRFFPIDKPKLVQDFLNKWKPNLVIFVDSEIWPNFLFEIKKNKIPLVLLNGRITKKTFLRWNFIYKTAYEVFQNFDLCLASSEQSKKYLEKLQVKNIKYIGNLKLTSENNFQDLPKQNIDVLIKNKCWCAVSTHKGEEIFSIKAHINLKKIYSRIITIIIPRHINRVFEIESLCKKFGLNTQILNYGDFINDQSEIILINSYGEVPKYLKYCNSVFIGKSMIKKLKTTGGQNPIEAAKLGCKIYHGPYVYNFKEVYDFLKSYNISETIHNDVELSEKIKTDLTFNSRIKDKKRGMIENLGKKILENTFDELVKVANK